MCGIFFSAIRPLEPSINAATYTFQQLRVDYEASNAARGPDAQNTVVLDVGPLKLEFFASELRLRGDRPIVQPHEKDHNVLCWNGEVFEGMQINPDQNDGVLLMNALVGIKDVADLVDIFGNIEGPYAFVFYHASSQQLYFARDPLGRRSLLISKPSSSSPYFILASASAGPDDSLQLEELSTDHIFCLDVHKWQEMPTIANAFKSYLTSIPRIGPQRLPSFPYAQPRRVNTQLPGIDDPIPTSLDSIPPFLDGAVTELITQLSRSVMLQVADIPQEASQHGQARVAVLFSGGIDCTVLAFFAHNHLPLDEPIDLLNVAFHNPRKSAGNELPKRQKHNKNTSAPLSGMKPNYMVPDRLTGLEEVEELRRLCPGRKWNFVRAYHDARLPLIVVVQVEVDVPYEDSQAANATVEALMFPRKTVMDLSLAIALYFASKGVGNVRSHLEGDPISYTSPARVLLNGLGSDELLGGYGRHRTAFSIGGWPKVITELQLEIDRIPTRNLGRDDRVMSSHGKETRHPFLSLSVVNFIAQLPVHYKMHPELELGLGDKMLLRMAARKVGLVEGSSRKKRAMQFGSHSARMHGEKRGDVDLHVL